MIPEVPLCSDAAADNFSNSILENGNPTDMNVAMHDLLLGALDLLPMGVIVVNRTCKIEALNRAARHAFDSSDTIADVSGFVTLTIKSQERRLRDAVRAACEIEGSRYALRISRPFGRPLMVLVQSTRGLRSLDGRSEPMALIFLTEPAWTHRVDEQVLRELFGFTPAEARVAAVLMQGRSVETAATTLGISENTTRNHLKRLFVKTKTNKQGELVQLLLRSPALMTMQLDARAEELDDTRECRAS